MSSSEREALLSPAINNDPKASLEFPTYKRRWYILLVFSTIGFTQGFGWNAYGPIAHSAEYAFDWDNSTIALFALYGPIMFIILAMGVSYITQRKGLRVICLMGMACVLIAGVLRCITTQPPAVFWVVSAAQILNAAAGPVAMSIVSAVSATWFPSHQRTTATALANRCMSLGGAMPNILGSYMVREFNTSVVVNTSEKEAQQMEVREDIRKLMIIEASITAVFFLMMVVYFPAQPPRPPSPSSAAARVDFKQSVKDILGRLDFWLIGAPYALAYGVYVGFSTTLDVNLKAKGISQIESGWIAFSGTLAGAATSVLFARLADWTKGKTKPILICLYISSALSSLWFAMVILYLDTIPYGKVQLYVAQIVCSMGISSIVPLVFETLCETLYPAPESVTNSLITMLKNFWVLVFLVVAVVLNNETSWMNWGLLGAMTACIPLLLIFKQNNRRLDVDITSQ